MNGVNRSRNALHQGEVELQTSLKRKRIVNYIRSFLRISAISQRWSGLALSHTLGSRSVSSASDGPLAMQSKMSFRYAQGSTKLFLQLAISDVRIAARWPARSLPTNSQFLRPIAIGCID